MQLQDILYSQGFGTRRVCAGLIQQGLVQIYDPGVAAGAVMCIDAASAWAQNGLRFRVQGVDWPYQERAYLMLHKPRGCVSATRDDKHPSVLGLVDHPQREELHLVGRLDFNTTGLLLLTNDSRWSSAITLPERRIPKTYRVETRDEITPEYAERFREGMYFRHENLRTRPATLEVLGPRLALLTLCEGRYHQVKRMFGSFRNPVLALHRESVGPLRLDESLAPGQYRDLDAAEVACLRGQAPTGTEPET